MKCEHFFGIASLGLALAAACGGSDANIAGDGGPDSTSSGGGSGSGSGATASSSGASSSGASSSGASSSGASSSGGRRDAGALTRTNDCPNCPGSDVCCLAPMGSNLQGTCAATAAACPSGAAAIPCSGGDCNGTDVCCVTPASSGGPSSTSCQASCPSGSPPACGGSPRDNVDCPGGPAGWACQPIPGTPMAVVGQCIPMEGGAPPADAVAPDTGTPDAEGGPPPQDAATDGG
jgi:hypothetical protein